MQASDLPARIPVPFANAGTKNTIPDTASPTPGLASFTTGFPPLTMTPLASGGIPPAGNDFNGVLYRLTLIQQWQNAGGLFTFNTAFSTTVGGYPKGAILLSTDGATTWISKVDNNTTDPDGVSPTNWGVFQSLGVTAITGLTNANVTLTAIQAARPVLTLAGLLTGNVQIIFPVNQQLVSVRNNTTGAFSVTCKTAAGTGAVVTQGGGEYFYGDGTNLVPSAVSTQAAGDSSSKPASTAYADNAAASGASAHCYLTTSGLNLILLPANGGRLLPFPARSALVPMAGITCAPTGLAATTGFYIYAVQTSGVVSSLEASATGWTADPTTGIPCKTGDSTRLLVGWARTDGAAVWTITPTLVSSYYNRRLRSTRATLAPSQNISSATLTELSATVRCSFFTWGDEMPEVFSSGTVFSSSASGSEIISAVAWDAGSTEKGSSFINMQTPARAQFAVTCNSRAAGMLAEGAHYATLYGASTAGIVSTWLGGTVDYAVQVQVTTKG